MIDAAGGGQFANDLFFLAADGQSVLIDPRARPIEPQSLDGPANVAPEFGDRPLPLAPARRPVSLQIRAVRTDSPSEPRSASVWTTGM